MKTKMETIRQAVLMHRGGLKEATNAQIKVVWDSLDEKTQKQYLENLKSTGTPKERKGK